LALQTIEKGITFSKSLNLDYDYLSLNYEKFRLLKAQKKNSEAKAVLEQILKDKKFYSNKKNRLVFLSEMAELEKENGNFESALRYTEQYLGLNDSVHADNEKMQMMNIESQFKTKEQEKALVHLETKNHQQKIILWISLALVLALVSFFLYAIRQRKKNNEQRLITLEQNRINEVKKALAEGENHERERIAKDLHDGIGGRITGIKINLEHLAQTTGIPELYTTVNQLEICLSEIRNTARNLTPETLHKFGLEEALKDFCQSLNTGNIRISCYIKNLNSCTDIEKQVHIFRIVQEAVTNVLKHASANKILVQCTLENQLLLIDVEDDGKGFTPDDKSKNLGLRNIQKRVDALGGKLKIESSEGNGTVLSVEANV
jgi:signal transduction histidine kinase